MEALSPESKSKLKKFSKIGAGIAGAIGAGSLAYSKRDEISEFGNKALNLGKKLISKKDESTTPELKSSHQPISITPELKSSHQTTSELTKEEQIKLEKEKQKAAKLKENMEKSKRNPRDIEAERKAKQLKLKQEKEKEEQRKREKTTRDNMGIIPKKPSWWERMRTADKEYAEKRNAKFGN
jgi:hypothetical protein